MDDLVAVVMRGFDENGFVKDKIVYMPHDECQKLKRGSIVHNIKNMIAYFTKPVFKDDVLDKDCAICLENLDIGSLEISCGHMFHIKCFVDYMMITFEKPEIPKCPLCRNLIIKK